MRKIISLALFILLFLAFKTPAFAEKINSFDVSVVAHKNGEMDITESIVYDFESSTRHGIFRYIPLYSRVGDLYRIIEIDNISVIRDGEKEKFEKSQNKENITFKIGDADKTITGPHLYKISYTVKNGIGSNFEDHDEIYWNVTGNGWEIPIEKASIKFDTGEGIGPQSLMCFTGTLGATDKNCRYSSDQASTNKILYAGEGLTVVAVYPKGTFPPSILSKDPPTSLGEKVLGYILRHIVFIYVFLNIVVSSLLLIWYQKHKNKKRFGKPAVNFDIPKDAGERIAPAIAGTIDSAKLERDDIVATIFDLAIRRYLRIEEEKTVRTLLPDSKKEKIIKLRSSDGLEPFEKKLFDRLFHGGDEVYLNDLRKDFYMTFEELEKSVFSSLVKRKYFTKNPKVTRTFLFILGIFSAVTANVILAGTFFFLSNKLIGRTPLGDEIDFRIDGLKLFLKSMNRNYKWQAKKFYTVEQMIPYAIALGYIDRFMEQLKIIKPDYNPSWYRGYSGSFYASYGIFYSSVSSSITTSAPSSSSGFSGGSSGGGGGGGGGGSW